MIAQQKYQSGIHGMTLCRAQALVAKSSADGKDKGKDIKPKGPTWTIRVYDGGELREEEVELEMPKAEPGTGADAGQSKSWKGWLQSTFSGGK